MSSIEANIGGIARLLAQFTETGDINAISEARKRITALHMLKAEVALPLWELAISIQRSRINPEEGAA